MTHVYIAASSREPQRVRVAQRMLLEAGHALTLDWLPLIEAAIASGHSEATLPDGIALANAQMDLDAIRAASVVWFLAPQEPTRGAWAELGFAIGIGKPIVVSGPGCRQSIFCRFGLLADSDAEGLALVGRVAL